MKAVPTWPFRLLPGTFPRTPSSGNFCPGLVLQDTQDTLDTLESAGIPAIAGLAYQDIRGIPVQVNQDIPDIPVNQATVVIAEFPDIPAPALLDIAVTQG